MRAAELWLATCMPVVHELSLTMTKPWWCNRESAIIFAVIFNICCYFLFFLFHSLCQMNVLYLRSASIPLLLAATTGFSIISEFWCSIQLNIRSIGVNECSTANTDFESNEYALHMFQSANLNEFSGLESSLRYFIW